MVHLNERVDLKKHSKEVRVGGNASTGYAEATFAKVTNCLKKVTVDSNFVFLNGHEPLYSINQSRTHLRESNTGAI